MREMPEGGASGNVNTKSVEMPYDAGNNHINVNKIGGGLKD